MKRKTARKEILSARAALLATRSGRRRPVGWIIMAAVALTSALAAPAAGQPIEEPKTYAGDFWSRPRLTESGFFRAWARWRPFLFSYRQRFISPRYPP